MATRYIDPTTDFGFKKLFGEDESKPILKRFLFDILGLSSPIAEITFFPTEKLPRTPQERKGIFDVYCRDETGREFIVEMGKYLKKHGKNLESVVLTAYNKSIPVFCPAFSDSSAGFGLVFHQTEKKSHIAIDSVKDFKELSKLDSLRDFWNNRVIRLLMVVALANVGSMIGTFVALPYLLRLGFGG